MAVLKDSKSKAKKIFSRMWGTYLVPSWSKTMSWSAMVIGEWSMVMLLLLTALC